MSRRWMPVVLLLVAVAPLRAEEAGVPHFDGLGSFSRKIDTDVPEAQRYFDQGLAFLYAFNHDEAIRAFREAARLDPDSPMPWWGVALANGPHINNPLVPAEREKAACEALAKARARLERANPTERALVVALSTRYADPQPAERRFLDEAYALAMRGVWATYPNDAAVGALTAEALMDLRPWDLWTADGQPQPGTEDIVAILERTLELDPRHPLALHLYIHAVEASPEPHRAIEPADRLRDLQPGLGHLVHMPSHIDVRCGHWAKAVESNQKAIVADRTYRERSPQQEFYRLYMAHNHHMLAFAAIMRGQSKLAIEAVDEMVHSMPEEWVKANPLIADGFVAMPVEMLVRFGRWDEVLAAPEPPEYLPLARAMWRAARAVSYAAKGEVASAAAEQQAFEQARGALPAESVFGNNKGSDILTLASHMVAAEILYREGKVEPAVAEFRAAIACQDGLRYDEPPSWIHPVRHALGATLLVEGRATEAEQVYLEDLARLPENGWALFGLAQSLRMQKKDAEADQVEKRFAEVWKDADVKLTSSCFCQPGR